MRAVDKPSDGHQSIIDADMLKTCSIKRRDMIRVEPLAHSKQFAIGLGRASAIDAGFAPARHLFTASMQTWKLCIVGCEKRTDHDRE